MKTAIQSFNNCWCHFCTFDMVLLVGRVPCNPGNPVVGHAPHHLAAPPYLEHLNVLCEEQTQMFRCVPVLVWEIVCLQYLYLCEIKILLESQNHVSIDVDFLLCYEVIWTNVTTRYCALPWKLQPLMKEQYSLWPKMCSNTHSLAQIYRISAYCCKNDTQLPTVPCTPSVGH